jgi:S1-C subfamily serine protease
MPKARDVDLLRALSHQLEELGRVTAGNVVSVRSREREVGSGFIWRSGIVVTASDLVTASEEISVLIGQQAVGARLTGRDPATGIAVLQLSEGQHDPDRLAISNRLGVGQIILAVGRTNEGLIQNLGMISSVSGPWRSKRGGRIDRLIRLDIQLDEIAEGGLVVDAEGGLIGMAVLGPKNRPIALPITTIEQIASILLSQGQVRRSRLGPHLGLGLHSVQLDKSLTEKYSVSDDQATVVVNVDPNGAAAKAGVLVGDIILTIDRERHTIQASPSKSVKEHHFDLKMLRAGQITTTRIVLGKSSR